ncbi:MAG TPA: S-layer homology domain-containing protein, partial [Desulfobacteria bacterium]|nr:S-layer homology domain-containing protein [Desulfobacteria bacterium]
VRETKHGLAIVAVNGKCAVINQSGRVIVPLAKFGGIGIQDNGYIIASDENGYRWGLIDSKGNTVLKTVYSSIVYMGHGYFQVSNQKGCAVFNESGEMVVPFGQFDNIGFYVSENMVDVRKNNLTGYINLPEYVAPPDEWAKPEVNRAVNSGLVPEDMRKKYSENISRADFSRLAINLIEVKTGMKIDIFMNTRGASGQLSDLISFSDTADPYVLAASRLGIVKGIGNNKFDPNGKITRQDAAVMLRQTAKVLEINEPKVTPVSFADSSKVSNYAVEAIAFVSAATDKESGIRVMVGTGNNNFSPQANYTRQQAYITALRLFNVL